MHLGDDISHSSKKSSADAAVFTSGPWWRELNRYHWFVFVVASLGWLFDTMDQQLFNIARAPAMRALAPESVARSRGEGGLLFGVLGDLLGRARSMVLTILLYSVFTGLSAISVGFWDFAAYRFL